MKQEKSLSLKMGDIIFKKPLMVFNMQRIRLH